MYFRLYQSLNLCRSLNLIRPLGRSLSTFDVKPLQSKDDIPSKLFTSSIQQDDLNHIRNRTFKFALEERYKSRNFNYIQRLFQIHFDEILSLNELPPILNWLYFTLKLDKDEMIKLIIPSCQKYYRRSLPETKGLIELILRYQGYSFVNPPSLIPETSEFNIVTNIINVLLEEKDLLDLQNLQYIMFLYPENNEIQTLIRFLIKIRS